MSLILDALNRAEQERSEQQLSPGLQAAPLSATNASLSRSRGIIAGVLAAATVFAALYLHFFSGSGSGTTPLVDSVMTVSPTVVGNTMDTLPQQLLRQTVGVQPAPAIALQTQSTPASALTNAQPDRGNTPATAVNSDTIARLYQQQPAAPTGARTASAQTPPASAAVKMTAKPSAEQAGRAILQQIPLLATMPARFQRSVPSIDYSVHVFNEKDGSGIVSLNGSIRKIGAQISPGLRVIAILPDSVVLDYNDIQFRLLALNSWVNF